MIEDAIIRIRLSRCDEILFLRSGFREVGSDSLGRMTGDSYKAQISGTGRKPRFAGSVAINGEGAIWPIPILPITRPLATKQE
jgi:hypothetical protein